MSHPGVDVKTARRILDFVNKPGAVNGEEGPGGQWVSCVCLCYFMSWRALLSLMFCSVVCSCLCVVRGACGFRSSV